METGFAPLNTLERLENELKVLPSNKGKPVGREKEELEKKRQQNDRTVNDNEDENFNIVDYLESFADIEEVSPYQGEVIDGEPPPTTVPLTPDVFSSEAN